MSHHEPLVWVGLLAWRPVCPLWRIVTFRHTLCQFVSHSSQLFAGSWPMAWSAADRCRIRRQQWIRSSWAEARAGWSPAACRFWTNLWSALIRGVSVSTCSLKVWEISGKLCLTLHLSLWWPPSLWKNVTGYNSITRSKESEVAKKKYQSHSKSIQNLRKSCLLKQSLGLSVSV